MLDYFCAHLAINPPVIDVVSHELIPTISVEIGIDVELLPSSA